MKVFLDTNVLNDFLAKRPDFFDFSLICPIMKTCFNLKLHTKQDAT